MTFNKYNGNYNITGKNIAKFRKQQKMSQSQLSNQLATIGIILYQADIFNIENNNRTIRDFELFGISQILNVPINELFLP